MKWIVRWCEIVDASRYVVCPVNARSDKSLYLSSPVGFYEGWRVKRLLEGCYAALECPPFDSSELMKRSCSGDCQMSELC